MADEFAKGFGILTGAGLVWMVIAAWYQSPSFTQLQLFHAPPNNLSLLDQLALFLGDVMGYFAIFGAITFWVIIPAVREFRGEGAE
ncbi:MAG: hypothetical protein ABEI86_00560 [Halobacteriaceae archaeon]